MNKCAVVTGAGSGVGRSVAINLVRHGWRVAVVGRRESALQSTAKEAGIEHCLICPCDIGNWEDVQSMAQQVLEGLEAIDVLVNAAGTNAPRRSLEILSLDDYHTLINTNLNGAYYCSQAFLPNMRANQSGTIIHIVSEAGKWANSKAGPAYVMSKFGQAGLVQAINAEERAHGIRACAIFPGDIDTPLLEKRPHPPSLEARGKMLTPQDLADCVMLCVNLPSRAIVEELLLRPA